MERKILKGIKRTICGVLMLQAASSASEFNEENMCRQVIAKAVENHFRGRFKADLHFIKETLRSGPESFLGEIEFRDEMGERKISLQGPYQSYLYESKDFGQEQWITDNITKRIRRIANRQRKKNAFASVLTYDDLVRFPSDFLLSYLSCKDLSMSDSNYTLKVNLSPGSYGNYTRMEATLSKFPILIQCITLYNRLGDAEKSIAVESYQEVMGKWVFKALRVSDADSISTVTLSLSNYLFQEEKFGNGDHRGLAGFFSNIVTDEKKGDADPAGSGEAMEN